MMRFLPRIVLLGMTQGTRLALFLDVCDDLDVALDLQVPIFRMPL